MLDVFFTAQFRRDYKLAKKQGRNIEQLLAVVNQLAREEALSPKYLDHPLTGNYKGHRECHLSPDWLLVYKIDRGALILTLSRTGTHSELFGK